MVKLNSAYARTLKYKSKNGTPFFTTGIGHIEKPKARVGNEFHSVQQRLMNHYFPVDGYKELNARQESTIDFYIETQQYKPNEQDKAFDDFVKSIDSGKYVLFFDDDRQPSWSECLTGSDCIVVRTNADAIAVVEKFGLPAHMHLDYWVANTDTEHDTVMPFLEYLYEKFKGTPDLWFTWSNHSQHEYKSRTDKMLYELLRSSN